ncbi:MAG TPA: SprT family zinc-dependent metalloprotease [Patescibacteria group bacterium]|nr:SprT family zinc-dependent metalloprotease [Patescibacteria group bacterium]
MAYKQLEVPGVGTVKLYKRRDARALKITIAHDNHIRVTLPMWLPYRAGLEFVKIKQDWIATHRRTQNVLLEGQLIGKSHRLRFVAAEYAPTQSTRVTTQEIRIMLAPNTQSSSPGAQQLAKQASIKALRQEAEALLPIRLKQLATQYGFEYKSVSIKQLKARWGSCSHQQHISLSLFLMLLPWPLIDYVLLHELTHTKALNHGKDFWDILLRCQPKAKELRRELRAHQPSL